MSTTLLASSLPKEVKESKQEQQHFPIILLLSRDLKNDEQKQIYKYFTNIITIGLLTSNKKFSDFSADTCIIVDLRDKIGRQWYNINVKLLDTSAFVVWIRCSGHEVEGQNDELLRKYDVKKWDTNLVNSKDDLLFHLAQAKTTPTIQSRKKKVLRRLLSCVFGCLK